MAEIDGLRALIKKTVARFQRYEQWHRGRIDDLGDPEENWPRDSELELIEARVLDLSQRMDGPTARKGWDSHETYKIRHAGHVKKAYDEHRIPAESGDSGSPFRVLCAANARATILWLQHTLDYLELLGDSVDNSQLNWQTPKRVILILAASPRNLDILDQDIEIRVIREELAKSKLRDSFIIEVRQACRPRDILDSLLSLQPEIVHFSGHGSSTGELLLESTDREAQVVTGEALSQLFKGCADHVRCVVLSACYAQYQATAIKQNIQFVIGMKTEISDDSAILFSRGFYMALGSGEEFPEAFRFAVAGMHLENDEEHLTPVFLGGGRD